MKSPLSESAERVNSSHNAQRNQMITMADIEPGGFRGSQDVDKKMACVGGGGREIRTPDLLNAIQALYQLSYTPINTTGSKLSNAS